MDQGVRVDQHFIEMFKEADKDVQTFTNITKATAHLCKSEIARCKEMEDEYRAIRKKCEAILLGQRKMLKDVLESGVSLVGSEKEYFLANSAPSLKTAYPIESKTFSNVIPEDAIGLIPQKFLIMTQVYQIKKDEIKTYISNDHTGDGIVGFYIERNKHVRERNVKK